MNHLDNLVDFLEYLGVDIYEFKDQSVVLDDAIINIHFDGDNLLTFSVTLTEYVTDGTGNNLNDIFGDDFSVGDVQGFKKPDSYHYVSNFQIGSKVTVDGYDGEVFRVDGANMAYDEETMYYLTNMDDGGYYEAFEGDMRPYDEPKIVKIQPEPELDVNRLLDEYNDYMALYNRFGDKVYEDTALEIIEKLKGMVE